MKFLLSILIAFLVVSAYAADDTLKTRNIPPKIPRSQLISQKRAILLDYLLEKNIPQIRNSIRELEDMEDVNYFAVFQSESLMLSYETGDFEKVLDLALRNEEINN